MFPYIKVCAVGLVTSLCYGLYDPRLQRNVIFSSPKTAKLALGLIQSPI